MTRDIGSEPAADAELVRRAQRGEMAAYEMIFRRYYPALLRFATARTGDRDVAEEIVESMFAALLTRRTPLVVRGSLEGFLVGAVRNAMLAYYRTESREQKRRDGARQDAVNTAYSVVFRADGASHEDAGSAHIEHAVTRAIAELPERHQAMLVMRWMNSMTYESIAEAMGMTPAAVKMQLSRTLRTLRERSRDLL